MTLARISSQNEKSSYNLGVKKVILTLIEIAREDAGVLFSDEVYMTELGYLRDFETTVEQQLHCG